MSEEIILNVDVGTPYYYGCKAYVTQNVDGATITIIDKDGTTTATVEDGAAGKGIESVTLNADYTLTITYTDGTSATTTSIRGATGASGVYIGSSTPTDPAVDVWIDTTGDPYPIDSEVERYVNNWLVDHPEATTTVMDGAVTNAKIASGAVTKAKMANGSVDTAQIIDGKVTKAKLDSALSSEISTATSNVATLQGDVSELQTDVATCLSKVGAPLVASTVAGMTDHTKIYVYTGSETGYTSGNWYYWNGSAWASGGVYNSTALNTDTTLLVSGAAADSATVGTEITNLKDDYNNKIDLRTTEKGTLSLLYLENMTMNTSGVIYASTGKRVAYAKVCKDLVISFFALNNGVATPQLCRYGLYASVPASGSSPTYGSNSSSYTAEIEQDCYVAFTHPSVTNFSATYMNSNLDKYTKDIEGLAIKSLFNYVEAEFTDEAGITSSNAINTDSAYYRHYTKAVTEGELVRVAGVNFASASYPLYRLKNGDTTVYYYHEDTATNEFMTKTFYVPSGVDTLVVNDQTNIASDKRGIFSPSSNEDLINELSEKIEDASVYYTDNNNVLWIGTSIPEGATYPKKACNANGYSCLNKSLGSSKLCFEGTYISGADVNKGRRLTATVDELESLYRDDVTNGVITEATLTMWKNYSYENSIIPYIDGTNDTQVSMIVIDHGFNDRATINAQMEDVDNIDWASNDRATFTGAFKYLIDKIQVANPFIKIVIGGYFTNTVNRLSFSYYSPDICAMQTLIAEKYNFSILKVWEHTQISDKYIDGTDDYISDFNSTYGTSYTKITPDADGNITALQLYCPDGMHPHSDLTGNCNKRLNAVYTKLLAHMI